MEPLHVTFLGTGDAFSAAGSFQAGYLVRNAAASFLLDCGASTLTSMKRFGVDPSSVDFVVLSHLHGDHFAGLPYLLLEYKYEHPRQRPLQIAGPPGTEERVLALYRAAYRELAAQPLPFVLEFVEMPPGRAVQLGEVRLEPFRVPHQDTDVSLGVRVHVGARTVLYSGDTGWTEELIRRSENTDLFICECCFFETRLPVHLDYPRIAEHRARFGAQRMILTHLGREVIARRRDIDLPLALDGLTVDL
jgi:ribonuclease BN (tRNA processing enzyme)